MDTQPTEQVLIVLTVAPTLETQLIDWLLARSDVAGFSSCAIHGHGSRHDHLSIAEQVTGRQRRLQFQLQLDRRHYGSVLADLGTDFAGTDLHYWVTPILAAGHLGEIPSAELQQRA